jgi:hypothetical protein
VCGQWRSRVHRDDSRFLQSVEHPDLIASEAGAEFGILLLPGKHEKGPRIDDVHAGGFDQLGRPGVVQKLLSFGGVWQQAGNQ